jgi:anaerobic selenocysteine-containing dehydrogenase
LYGGFTKFELSHKAKTLIQKQTSNACANVKYPYACKILITYFGNPIYVLPAGHKYIDVLKDSDKLSLQIAIDIVISETSMLADYIISESFHYNFLF